ncbi:pilus (MSHA type) biogenesis protein MshL [Ideonella sp. 4Y11]|uniref:Pilus (MSHA type) biogenesis protein MshL n=1 Tax=Ideonella aquatica TaxID=2824119 RepID=A0A941BFJ3_9BURK|nr:pilus (MSHA type) biogenesis protein MshL [Ideonella aquatica]MBQ0958826.1 pilus (MSHA type) biogenesis protein MshL [Ideonella aquatica]
MIIRPLLLAASLACAGLASAAPLPGSAPAAIADAAEGPRFDVAMNNAPASAVFAQLAVNSRFNMLVSPDVTGSVSLTLKDTTLMEALAALRDLYGYEFKVQGNRITVYSNTVQTRLFRINYLPGRRQGASDIRVSSSSITQAGTSGGSAATSGGASSTGSTVGGRAEDSAHVRTTSDADFWREVQSSLNALVGTAADRRVVLNPAAGVVVVRASPAELRQVEQYLGAVQINIERQVMIEAKIVDVVLDQESQQGINWSSFGKFLGKGKLSVGMLQPGATIGNTGDLVDGSGNLATPGSAMVANALGGGMYGIAFQAGTFAAMLNFLQTQGDVQVLSSPRIATLNNQKAVLKVGTDELYVTGVASTSTSTATSSSSTPTVTLQPFFSGIALDVTPQIDERGNVMLHVHPSISVVSERQKNVDLGSLGSYKLPLATSAVNETDSIVRVADGQIVAIGGLMTQSQTLDKSGLPVLGDMPLVGKLFSQKNAVSRKRELVILMKPTVIQDGRWPESAEDARARQVSQLEAPAR